jgi:hypothetical protein
MKTPLFGDDANGGICSTVEWMNGAGSIFVFTSVVEVVDVADVVVRIGG